MKNTFGSAVTVTIFGESHGPFIGAVIDGLSPGMTVDASLISRELEKRRPSTSIDTPRKEKDDFQIISGVFNGKTTGTPITVIIPNENTKSSDYTYGLARPSHADYAAFCKYHGYEDFRGGGHFSGRITAALTAVGGILLPALSELGIKVGTHILRCGGICDDSFSDYAADIEKLNDSAFPTISDSKGAEMKEKISEAAKNQNSIGGITQTAICGIPAGVGEPWFDSVEGLLSHALFSLGGVKGIEFGMGFGFAETTGADCNDSFRTEGGKIITVSNNNGGINGGITNGMPVVFSCAVKPTPSISKVQKTVDFKKGENSDITITGRHDPAIIRRICPVINSVSAIVIADLLTQRYGTDVFLKGVEK